MTVGLPFACKARLILGDAGYSRVRSPSTAELSAHRIVPPALRPAKQGWRRAEEFVLIFNSQMRLVVAQLYRVMSCFSVSAASPWECRNAFPASPQVAWGFSLPFPHLMCLPRLQTSPAFQGAARLFLRVCIMRCIMRLPGTMVTNTIMLLHINQHCMSSRMNKSWFVFHH